jgi:hypothetical protein
LDVTLFLSPSSELYVRAKIVLPRIAHATVVQMKMKAMAAIRFVMEFFSRAACARTFSRKVHPKVKYFI